MIALRVFCSLQIFVGFVFSAPKCAEKLSILRFYKLRSCHRSNGVVVTKGRFASVADCMQFTREKGGLAINFSPPEQDAQFFNCHVLACPEGNNLTYLIRDPGFDYYSAYGNLEALENSSCIRGMGVFKVFPEPKNYSSAILTCQKHGGDLANVVSETRTNTLSEFINNTLKVWYKTAYVGLDDVENEGKFVTVNGDALSCFKFRAWAPGHPRKKHGDEDCVALDDFSTWKSYNCSLELPFLCELDNEGPGKSLEMFNVNCASITNRRDRRRCKLIKIRMNDIYDVDEEDLTSEERCPEEEISTTTMTSNISTTTTK